MSIKIVCVVHSYWHKSAGHHSYFATIYRVSDGASVLIHAVAPSNVRMALYPVAGHYPGLLALEDTLDFEQCREMRRTAVSMTAEEIQAFARG